MSKIGKFLLFMAIVIGGFFLGYWLASSGLLTHLAGISLLDIAAIIWVLACSFLLQIVLHEGGHVLAGWLVGMDLILFRLGSHVWYRSPEGWQHGREYVDGIGGQALMVPGQPSHQVSKRDYILYLLGGVAMNFILGALLIVWAYTSSRPWNLGLLIGGGSAWLLGLVNLLPTIPYSDGAHVWQLLKDPKAPSELFRAMKLQEQLNQGTPYYQLAADYPFTLPLSRDHIINTSNALVKAHGLYESGQFEAASSFLKQLYQEKDQAMPIHQVAIDELYLATLLMEVVTGQVTLTDVQTSIEAILDNKAFTKRFKQPTASNYRIRALLKIVFDKDWDQARQALESGKDLIAQCGSTTDCRFEALAYRRIQDYLDK